MEYNTQRPPMRIAEYGRTVQKMIEKMKALPDREARTQAAHKIVNVMSILNSEVKEQAEYKHTLWDHLFHIAGYDLDVDAPYPVPEPEQLLKRPEKPSYASNHIRYRFYGRIVQDMINAAKTMEGPDRDRFINNVASYMKMAYRNWNNEEKVTDEQIINHIREMSGGAIVLEEITDLAAHQPQAQPQRSGQQNRQNRQGRQNRNFRKGGNKGGRHRR